MTSTLPAVSAPGLTGRRATMATLLRERTARIGATIIVVLVLLAVFAPLITRISGQDPYAYHSDVLGGDGSPLGALGGASATHWFGVEPLTGRDLFSIVAYGARTSILVGLASTAISVVIGVVVGTAAAVLGGWWDRIISRVIDVMFGFPSLIFMIALGAFAPVRFPKALLVILVIGFFGWPGTARVVRGQSLALMNRTFVTASRAMGAGAWHVVREQLLPNLAGTLIVLTTMAIPANIGAEAALSFLGVGVPPPTPAWGRTISTAIAWIATDPWYLLAPAGALFLITFGFNLVGDALRDALDPRLAGRS